MPEKNYTGLEERTAKVEGLLEQMNKRLDRVEVGLIDLKNEIKSDMERLETRLRADMGKMEAGLRADMEKMGAGLRVDMGRMETGLRADMGTFNVRLEKLETKVDSQFKWLVGIIVGTWITTMSALITAILFKG